jgi:hypothetical protein
VAAAPLTSAPTKSLRRSLFDSKKRFATPKVCAHNISLHFTIGSLLIHDPGAVCGSGDLNGRMRQFAIHHLRNELYLEEAEGMTIANIVEAEIMPKFEGVVKRIFSLTATDRVHYFRIRGLRESCTNPVLKQNNFALGL